MVCLLATVSPSLGDAIHAAAVAGNEELLQELLAEQPQQATRSIRNWEQRRCTALRSSTVREPSGYFWKEVQMHG